MANLVLREITCLHFLSQLISFFLLPLSSDAYFEQAFYKRLEKTYLSNHVFQTVFVRGEIECGLQCLREETCLSVNFGAAQENGLDVCELNNASIEMSKRSDVSERVGFTHLDPIFSLGSKRRPGKSCLDVLTRTDEPNCLSSGEYWINNDSIGPLKVFCDMKTNGECMPATCKEALQNNRYLTNGVQELQRNENTETYRTYCHMSEIPGCGAGGWTLVMKMDGDKDTFQYFSSYWSNNMTYQVDQGLKGLTEEESKLASYWNTPFTKICLGMKVHNNIKWVKLDYSGKSLHSVIADNGFRATSLSRSDWLSLINGSSLQTNCNREGFNAKLIIRLGILGNNEDDCVSPDTWIGFGVSKSHKYTVGCRSGEYPATLTDIKAFGYILVQ